jgi:hypothetical protein
MSFITLDAVPVYIREVSLGLTSPRGVCMGVCVHTLWRIYLPCIINWKVSHYMIHYSDI